MSFGICYSDGSQRGPFESLDRARSVFENAPIMPGQRAYLFVVESDEELDFADGPAEDEEAA